MGVCSVQLEDDVHWHCIHGHGHRKRERVNQVFTHIETGVQFQSMLLLVLMFLLNIKLVLLNDKRSVGEVAYAKEYVSDLCWVTAGA